MQKILNFFFVAQKSPGILLDIAWKNLEKPGIPLFQSPKNPDRVNKQLNILERILFMIFDIVDLLSKSNLKLWLLWSKSDLKVDNKFV